VTDTITLPMQVDRPADGGGRPGTAPCSMVILGAGGDLTRRKLIPALLHLLGDGLLDDDFLVLGVGRKPLDDEAFREEQRAGNDADAGLWRRFAPRLCYLAADLDAPTSYTAIAERLARIETERREERGRLFYLALPPSVYAETIEGLARSGAMPRRDAADPRWARVIIEKPFGSSLATAQTLNRLVRAAVGEHQIYRIDHYLGKETVQNLLVFRFANLIFEPMWNRHHIQHVQITAAEAIGVEHRARYYEEAGAMRDMFQNHLLSLLSLIAMEPPAQFRSEAVRDEKTKVLNAVRVDGSVRGQYGPGRSEDETVPGYREEEGVPADSATPTYAALRCLIDNWRWQGVPFLLRSGKRLARRYTEIAVQFHSPPHLMFPLERGEAPKPNLLVFRVQPDEGLSLSFGIKCPGSGVRITQARMEFGYDDAFGASDHDAYETLLLDCMAGDPMLFLRNDATEAAWRVVDPVIAEWESAPPPDFPNYAAGSWGPTGADRLAAEVGAAWRNP
jgi:glucose-6-phosphate 1-dehydrogenase